MTIIDQCNFDLHIEEAEKFIRMAEESLDQIPEGDSIAKGYFGYVKYHIGQAKAQIIMAELYVE